MGGGGGEREREREREKEVCVILFGEKKSRGIFCLHELQQIRLHTVVPTQHNALYPHDAREPSPRVPRTAPYQGEEG